MRLQRYWRFLQRLPSYIVAAVVNAWEEPEQELLGLMASLSENIFNAFWLDGLSHILWYAVESGKPSVQNDGWGMGVSYHPGPKEIARLRKLSEEARGWFIWDEKHGKSAYVPMDQWLDLYDPEKGKKYK